MAYNNIFLDSLLWMTPYNALPKSGGRTSITFSFGLADKYAIYGPDFRQDRPTNTVPWVESTAWDGLTDVFAKADSSGRYTLANGIQIDLGGRKGAQAAVYVALRMWSDIANIDVKQTSPFNADTKDKLKFLVTSNMHDYAGDDSTSAFAYQPINYSDRVKYTNLGGKYSPGYAVYDPSRWNSDVAPGKEGFYIILHEIGHLFGMDHQFYDGGGAAEPTVPEVFETGPGTALTYQFDDGAGVIASPGAFDIAAMHALYGANMAYKTGNDVYKLPTTDCGYFCLWDAAGIDTIDASDGAKAATIDLRPATLDENDVEGAAGRISRLNGVRGGFTIAKDAQIENAIGGSLGDSLHGNTLANKLDGRSGADTLQGGVGADTLIGGLGADLFVFTNLHDFRDRVGPYAARADDYIQDFNANEDKFDFRDFDADPTESSFDPKSFVFLGTRTNANQIKFSKSGAAELIFDATTRSLIGDINADGQEDLTIRVDFASGVTGASQLTKSSFIMRDAFANGTSGNDVLRGGDGKDTLTGAAGADTMSGGWGADVFAYTSLLDFRDRSGLSGKKADDYILDFDANEDKFDFRNFYGDSAGRDPKEFVFLGTQMAGADIKFSKSGAAELLFDNASKSLRGDVNGDGVEDLTIRVDFMPGVAGASQLTKQNFMVRDSLYQGTDGDDTLRGYDGNDTLVGGAGADTMNGGWGNDVFKFTGLADLRSGKSWAVDRIEDFVSGVDRLDFTSFDVDASAVTTYRQFRFIGNAAFQKGGGAQLNFDARTKILAGDVDGNSYTDFYIAMPGVASLSKADFIGLI